VQFPITDAYMKVRAADMMRYEAARLFDAGEPCGAEANMAKHLTSERPVGRSPTPALTPTEATASSTNTTSNGSSAKPACSRWLRSTTT
jgi:hypothetical protein